MFRGYEKALIPCYSRTDTPSYCTVSRRHTGKGTVVLANGAVVTIIVGMMTCLFDSISTFFLTQYTVTTLYAQFVD